MIFQIIENIYIFGIFYTNLSFLDIKCNKFEKELHNYKFLIYEKNSIIYDIMHSN